MLILSRRLGEAIVIEHRIEVVIASVVGGKVRLGIVAPDEVPVFRKEIEQGQPSLSAA